MEVFERAILGLFGGLFFAINFRVPIRLIFITASLAMASEIAELWLMGYFQHLAKVNFVVSLGLALTSQVCARITNSPAQIFLIPTFILLVPGTKLYEGVVHAINHQYLELANAWVQAGIVTTSMSFAILVATWLIPSKQEL